MTDDMNEMHVIEILRLLIPLLEEAANLHGWVDHFENQDHHEYPPEARKADQEKLAELWKRIDVLYEATKRNGQS